MSTTELRNAIRPRRTLWRNLLLTFAAVVTIVVGLLAMHSLNLEHVASSSMVSSAESAGHPMTIVGGSGAWIVTDDCGGVPCVPEHSMTAMACILALLVSVLLIGMIRVVTAWRPVHKRAAAHLEPWASLPMSAPPSLHVLCISRT